MPKDAEYGDLEASIVASGRAGQVQVLPYQTTLANSYSDQKNQYADQAQYNGQSENQ